MTQWAKDVSPDNVRQEYPRPQMVRSEWMNLNGLWKHAIQPRIGDRPDQFNGSILVPFPIESALSGVGRMISLEESLWYRRTFDVPPSWFDSRVLIHFGAVD